MRLVAVLVHILVQPRQADEQGEDRTGEVVGL